LRRSARPELSTLSLPDALPIYPEAPRPAYAGLLTTGGYASAVEVDANPGGYEMIFGRRAFFGYAVAPDGEIWWFVNLPEPKEPPDRKSTRLNSSHVKISYAVFC